MSYFISLLITVFALMPSSLDFHVDVTNQYWWTFLVLFSGFAGFFLLFQRVNPILKIIAVGGFINCFFSLDFIFSATAYVSLIAGCYFYWGCTRIRNWDIVFKTLLALVLLNCFMMAVQALGRDSLLNFGMGKNLVCYGTTGARMCVESLLIVSSAFLIQSRYKTAIWGMALAAIFYLAIFKMTAASQGGFLHDPFICRIPVWIESIKFSNQHPWNGWGIGTFKILYHVMSKLGTYPWQEAHNDFVQILFEAGYPGLILMLICVGSIFRRIVKQAQWKLLLGFVIILADMMVHFPLREFQCFLIVIAFLAYCEVRLRVIE